ncbi:MAG: hypothetical protein LBE91_02755 [Tannerella sp.]|jgi:hypothetical protein|nr:hypothetical protein [Tannerella sp.]
MFCKAKIKEIKALEFKKFRDESGLFVAEGNKVIDDMIHSFEYEWIIANSSWMATQGDAFFLPVFGGTQPAAEKLLAGVFQFFGGRNPSRRADERGGRVSSIYFNDKIHKL